MSFSSRDRPCSPPDGTDTLIASGPRASAIRQTRLCRSRPVLMMELDDKWMMMMDFICKRQIEDGL